MSDYERRQVNEGVEVRQDGRRIVATGYAAVFDRLSQNLGGFVERVAPGTFAKTIKEQDVRALFNHEAGAVLGRLSSGTLRLAEDEVGLRYEVDLPDTQLGRDVATLLKRGDVSGSSFGFRAITDEWSETEQGFPLRTLRQVSLRDVGPVTFPAYEDTEAAVALRSLADARGLDVEAVVAAAAANDLRSLLVPADEPEPPAQVVRHLGHLI